MPVGSAVPLDVPPQLLDPPLPVGLGHAQMLRARVPEATVNEDRDLGRAEQHVRTSSTHLRQRRVDSVPESAAVGLPPEEHLGSGVPTRRTAHTPRHLRARGRRSVVSRDVCSPQRAQLEATTRCRTLSLGCCP